VRRRGTLRRGGRARRRTNALARTVCDGIRIRVPVRIAGVAIVGFASADLAIAGVAIADVPIADVPIAGVPIAVGVACVTRAVARTGGSRPIRAWAIIDHQQRVHRLYHGRRATLARGHADP